MSGRMLKALKITLGVALFVVIIGSILLYGRSTSPADRPLSYDQEHLRREQVSTITLPGADSITFLHHDYDSDASIWAIVSKSRPLDDVAYTPSELVVPEVAVNKDKSREEQSLRPEAAKALKTMLAESNKAGHALFLASGYRSYGLQKTYYDNYVKTYGQQEADTFSAKPGYSEHQTGLAFDLADNNRSCYLDTCFETMPSAQWLAAHAHEFGFILRYPKDKTQITGYTYEPWHFRYVGVELATALHQSGLTLDEALPYFESAH